jgi:hypothetical protein
VDVEGLYGFDVQLSFDPAVVEVVDADPDKAGVQVSLGRMLDSGMAVRDSADNEAGTIHYAMTQINPSEAKSGTGNLIVIRLRGKAAGTTNLAFTSVDLARRDATAIDTAPQPGAVSVLAETSAQQPTTTPIPTQAPPTPVPTALSAAAQDAQAQSAATAAPPATATPAPPVPPTAAAQAPTDPPPTRAPEATAEGPAAPAATSSAAAAPAESPTAEDPATLPAAAAADDVATPSPEQPALAAVDPTPTAQAVALAPGQGQSGSAAAGDEQAQAGRSPEQTLLLVGVVALALAGLLGVVLVLVARRRTAAP